MRWIFLKKCCALECGILLISVLLPSKIPYPYSVFYKHPYLFRLRTPLSEKIRLRSVPVLRFPKKTRFRSVPVLKFQNRPVYVTFPFPYIGTGTERVRIPYPYSGLWLRLAKFKGGTIVFLVSKLCVPKLKEIVILFSGGLFQTTSMEISWFCP